MEQPLVRRPSHPRLQRPLPLPGFVGRGLAWSPCCRSWRPRCSSPASPTASGATAPASASSGSPRAHRSAFSAAASSFALGIAIALAAVFASQRGWKPAGDRPGDPLPPRESGGCAVPGLRRRRPRDLGTLARGPRAGRCRPRRRRPPHLGVPRGRHRALRLLELPARDSDRPRGVPGDTEGGEAAALRRRRLRRGARRRLPDRQPDGRQRDADGSPLPRPGTGLRPLAPSEVAARDPAPPCSSTGSGPPSSATSRPYTPSRRCRPTTTSP